MLCLLYRCKSKSWCRVILSCNSLCEYSMTSFRWIRSFEIAFWHYVVISDINRPHYLRLWIPLLTILTAITLVEKWGSSWLPYILRQSLLLAMVHRFLALTTRVSRNKTNILYKTTNLLVVFCIFAVKTVIAMPRIWQNLKITWKHLAFLF